MSATLNTQLYNSTGLKPLIIGEGAIDDLAGWAGDIQTLVKNVKTETNNSNDYDVLYNKAKELLGTHADSNFYIHDMLADVDAVNIYNEHSKKESITDTIQNYYNSDEKLSRRYTDFADSIVGRPTKRNIAQKARAYTSGYAAPLVKWPLLDDVNVTHNQSYAVSDAFTEFIMDKMKQEEKANRK